MSSARVEIALRDGQQRVKARKEELEETYRQQIDDISNKLDAKIQKLQGWYMLCAVLLPPIAPLMLAGFVFMSAAPRAPRRQQIAAPLRGRRRRVESRAAPTRQDCRKIVGQRRRSREDARRPCRLMSSNHEPPGRREIRFWRETDMSESVKTAWFVGLALVVGLVAFADPARSPQEAQGRRYARRAFRGPQGPARRDAAGNRAIR